MSKQDVIDYVMETPHNTNRAVLEGLVDTAVEESQVQADWNQNDTTAKDYIKNRICYEEEIVTELGKTFEIWQSLVKNSQGKIDYQNTPISYKIKDRIYTNVTGQYIADSRLVYATDIVSDYIFILGKDTSFTKEGGTIEAYYKNEVGDTEKTTDFQFVKIENTVKQIDSKFIPTASPDWSVNDETDPSYVKNRVGYYAEKKAAEKSTTSTVDVNERVTFILTFPDDNIDVYTINNNKDHLYLYYKAKRYPLIRSNYTGGTSTYNYKTIIPENNVFITFTFTTSTAAKGAHVIFNNESSRKITIEPGDLYITIPDPVEIPYDLIPLAGQQTRGGIKVYDISEPDGTSAYLRLDPETERLWYSPSIMGNIRSNILTKTILTNIVDQAGKTLICGSSDDTVSELNLMASNNFPVTVTYVGYEGTYPPTFIYLISTADGKRGKFTYAVSSQTLSPITWTFEGGGGGNSLFIITPTYDSDTKTWSTDRTWDEVKAAVAKSENPNDYAIRLDRLLIPPNGLIVNRNSSGEILNVEMPWIIISPEIVDVNEVPDGFGSGLVLFNNYVGIKYKATSSNIKFIYADSGEIPQAVIKYVVISESDDGTLICDPPNTVDLYGGFFNAPEPSSRAQIICPLYYNGETYHFETGEKDSSNIVSLYFSTTTNGIYKRLKITQGQNGAADTVVMDKEIELADSINNIMFRGVVASGTIYRDSSIDFRIENQDPYSKRAFQHLCNGTRNAYLKLHGANTSEYELEPGGFADGIYSLKYNGKDALKYNIKGANYGIGFAGDIYDIIKNDSKITGYELLADQFSYSVIPRNDIETDGTTIKFNEYGQLTLALSNANGVSF